MSIYSKPNMGSGMRCRVVGLNGSRYEIVDGGRVLTVINLKTGRPLKGNKDGSQTLSTGLGRYGYSKLTNSKLRDMVRNQTKYFPMISSQLVTPSNDGKNTTKSEVIYNPDIDDNDLIQVYRNDEGEITNISFIDDDMED